MRGGVKMKMRTRDERTWAGLIVTVTRRIDIPRGRSVGSLTVYMVDVSASDDQWEASDTRASLLSLGRVDFESPFVIRCRCRCRCPKTTNERAFTNEVKHLEQILTPVAKSTPPKKHPEIHTLNK
ncbi:hypothetical protein HGRIS_006912 [Hohenbuehelia grisea]|uniref:Uncharacterized protein n=1 Tax=Hohenbuehelia grisea TaxID=104357 RepID=A0ABR3JAG3_9AGAR